MFCTQCGAQNSDEQRFCTQCGSPLEPAPSPASQAPADAQAQTPVAPAAAPGASSALVRNAAPLSLGICFIGGALFVLTFAAGMLDAAAGDWRGSDIATAIISVFVYVSMTLAIGGGIAHLVFRFGVK